MDAKVIIGDVKNIVSEIAEIEIKDIDEKKSIWDDLEIDPLDYESIIMLIEEKYEIDISNEEYQDIDTVEDIVNIIKDKKKK